MRPLMDEKESLAHKLIGSLFSFIGGDEMMVDLLANGLLALMKYNNTVFTLCFLSLSVPVFVSIF